MSNPHAERLEQLRAQYLEQIADLRDTQRKMREISCTVTAPRQVVSVTVGHGGFVKDVRFPNSAYKKLAPAELSSVIVKAIADAQQQVARETATLMAPMLPPGVDAEKLFSGELDVDSFVPAEPIRRDAWGGTTRMRG